MAWYWWVLIVIGGILLLGGIASAFETPRQAPQREVFGGLEGVRDDIATRQAVGEAALELIFELPVVAAEGPGERQSREQVSANVRNMVRTRHVRLHLAGATERITISQELADRSGRAVVRSYQRCAAENWRVSTQMAANFDAAASAAEVD